MFFFLVLVKIHIWAAGQIAFFALLFSCFVILVVPDCLCSIYMVICSVLDGEIRNPLCKSAGSTSG